MSARTRDDFRPAPRPRAARARRLAGVLLFAAVAIALDGWPALRPRAGAGDALDAYTISAMIDSVKTLERRMDWVGALGWMQRAVARRPDEAYALSDLSVCLHNAAIGHRVRNGQPHAALRNSLQRIEAELGALAIADSAVRVAGSDAERWSHALEWHATVLENLGCVGDALLDYRRILARRPDAPGPHARAYWIEAHLREPRLPDRLEVPPR